MLRRTPFKRPQREKVPQPVYAPSKCAGVYGGSTSGQVVAKENPIVCEEYRRLVRQLPCIRCGIVGFTQFCHTDLGKGMGLKTDDRGGWPGCGPHGNDNGCHHYVGREMSREVRRAFEEVAAAMTRDTIEKMGLWPEKLPPWPAKG